MQSIEDKVPCVSINEDESEVPVPVCTASMSKSRSFIDQLTPAPKKKCSAESQLQTKELEFQTRAKESEVDGQFYVPVNRIQLPSPSRMIRHVDEQFLAQLKENMEKNPNGSYEPLYLVIKDIRKSEEFSKDNVETYNYEVLGGTHNVLATKQLSEKHPESTIFKGRYARLFVGLSDEKALWLASRHNSSGCFRHEMTFQDEVVVAHRQLQCIGEKDNDNNLVPNQQWRDSCSHILGKAKKNLSKVFTVAGLHEDGYLLFLEICKKYEKGELKEQRATSKDLKGKPAFKPSYVKCLFGLDVPDRVALLEQVANKTISLDEFKTLSKELKALKPTQKVICSFLDRKWEWLEEKLGEKINADQLKKFSDKDETNHLFRDYLQYLQTFLSRADSEPDPLPLLSPDIFVTDEGTRGVVPMCPVVKDLNQGMYGQEKGFTLALYKLPDTGS